MIMPVPRMSWALLVVSVACSPVGRAQSQTNALTAAEQAAGWKLLFDGKSTDGWRGYRMDSVPSGWKVVDGALTRVGAGRDLITREQFANFELALEWNISPGGNSGIMYRVTEEYEESYKSAPEMQVLDDAGHADAQSRLTAAGSNYDLYPAPAGVVKPAGQWNLVRILVQRNHVEHWLNGQKVVEYELMGPDWEARVKRSKFVEWPNYGRAKQGHIALQDHGDQVAYRNIKIRVLP
ncbi:MAG: DUF1080 domain-containing protein [Gemmatimonadetes bacterium]|nr:DUF1080 domain-containing protein [Gemmatimonadota bacterium]